MQRDGVKVHYERPRLQPIVNDVGSNELLKIEIERLQEANLKIDSTIQNLEEKVTILLSLIL